MPPTATTSTDEMVQKYNEFIQECDDEEIVANYAADETQPSEAVDHNYNCEYQDLTNSLESFGEASFAGGNRVMTVENFDDGMHDETDEATQSPFDMEAIFNDDEIENKVMGEQNASKVHQLLLCATPQSSTTTEDSHPPQPIADQPTDTIINGQQEEHHQPMLPFIHQSFPSHQESTVGSSSAPTPSNSDFKSINGRNTYLLVDRLKDNKEEVSFKFKVLTKRSDRRGTKLDTEPESVGEVVVKVELPEGKKKVYINMRDPTLNLEDNTNNDEPPKKPCVFAVLRTKFNLLTNNEVWIQIGDNEEKINVFCQGDKKKSNGIVFNIIDYNSNGLKCEKLRSHSRSSITPTAVVYKDIFSITTV